MTFHGGSSYFVGKEERANLKIKVSIRKVSSSNENINVQYGETKTKIINWQQKILGPGEKRVALNTSENQVIEQLGRKGKVYFDYVSNVFLRNSSY